MIDVTKIQANTVYTAQPTTIDSVLGGVSADIFADMELFFASSAAGAAASAAKTMQRAKASRAINDAKKEYQALGNAGDNNTTMYDKEKAQSLCATWIANFSSGSKINDAGKRLGFTDADVTKMNNVSSTLSDSSLNGKEKAEFDALMLPTFKRDVNGDDVLSDEIMTVMLSQANALYQNWISGFQKISTSKMETLKELIRALS